MVGIPDRVPVQQQRLTSSGASPFAPCAGRSALRHRGIVRSSGPGQRPTGGEEVIEVGEVVTGQLATDSYRDVARRLAASPRGHRRRDWYRRVAPSP